jgi:phytoene/squalene synthetase
MVEPRDLKRAIDELEALNSDIWKIITDVRPNWRRDLVNKRREFSLALAAFAALLRRAEVNVPLPFEEWECLRERLSGFRSAMAMHLINYPAVSIAAQEGSFRDSANAVSAAAADIFGHARRVFALN